MDEVGIDAIFDENNPDMIDAGATHDSYSLGAPNIQWYGGEGDDIIFAGRESVYDSFYFGGNGNDKLYGTDLPGRGTPVPGIYTSHYLG